MMNDSFFLVNRKLFADNEITYVSCPITSGEKFVQWYSSRGKELNPNGADYIQEKFDLVISQNVKNAKKYIHVLRTTTNKVVIDPTNLEDDSLEWSQNDYYQFWDKVIQDMVDEIIFLDGWEYSFGCCVEFLSATRKNIKRLSQSKEIISLKTAMKKIRHSIDVYSQFGMDSSKLESILNELQGLGELDNDGILDNLGNVQFKDDKLDVLISKGIANIAQFVSVEPDGADDIKYAHINNCSRESLSSLRDAIDKLINSAGSKAINIRSFSPQVMKGNKLIYNKKIEDIDEVMRNIQENSASGKYSIINENIDIHDGGVSGVVLKDLIEFAPEDTPKCVDKEDVCSLPRDIGVKLLNTVYGFAPDVHFPPNYRVEFSIHPLRQGVRKEHTIIWEYESYKDVVSEKSIAWPNRYSRFIGDKVFGLLIADALGFLVPRTTVLARKVAPFTFGKETGLKEKWIRTCPIMKEPGKYYTGRTWKDPFELMNAEELKGSNTHNLAAILSQDAVEALYSGASFIGEHEGQDLIEGVTGEGDQFMVGEMNMESLPAEVINAVKALNNQIRLQHNLLGNVSIEWVFDGTNVWIVQINQLRTTIDSDMNLGRVIVSGNPDRFEKVYVKDGLDNLREKIQQLGQGNVGIELIGNIGITSHFGDLLRLSGVPSILVREQLES